MGKMKLNNLPTANARRWTNLTRQCFSINCVCENCSYIPDDLKEQCNAKSYVLMLYAKFGKPGKDDEEEC